MRVYRLDVDNSPEYVATVELCDGNTCAALKHLFGGDSQCHCIENRPFEGDVWQVDAGEQSGRYLTRKTPIERE